MQIKIEKLNSSLQGVGFFNNKVIFVSNALVGEIVEVHSFIEKNNYLIAKDYEIVQESDLRIDSRCLYKECGGCDFDYVSIQDSIKIKNEIVKDNFSRLAHLDNLNFEIPCYNNVISYRARARVHVSLKDKKIGFLTKRGNSLVEVKNCPKLELRLNEMLQNPDLILKKARTCLFEKGVNKKTGFVELSLFNADNKVLIEKEEGKRIIAGYTFNLNASNFFQSNPSMMPALFSFVKENVLGDNIMDLYAGVGTFSTLFPDKNVISVERDKPCLALAKKNAPYAISYTGDVGLWAKKRKEKVDTVIVDPPRVGLDKGVPDLITTFNAERIIYVSCNSQTLARDIPFFKGYKVDKVKVFDFYPGTSHCETVAILSKIY